jgi:hypothetical protein
MNENEKLDTDTVSIKKGNFLTWLDNFWYHYKWHTLIIAFIIFTVTICTVQMCQKESYDMHILYAGGHSFTRNSEDGDYPEYAKAKSTLKNFVSDYDDNGEVELSLRDLFIPDQEDMKGMSDAEFQLAYNDREIMKTLIVSGDYYLCFLSAEVYDSFTRPEALRNLTEFVGEGVNVEYYKNSPYAIYLNSTNFSNLSGFSELPDDTLIVLRSTSGSTPINKSSNEKQYKRAEETLIKILNYGK